MAKANLRVPVPVWRKQQLGAQKHKARPPAPLNRRSADGRRAAGRARLLLPILAEDEDGAGYGLIRRFETRRRSKPSRRGRSRLLAPKSTTLTGALKRGGLARPTTTSSTARAQLWQTEPRAVGGNAAPAKKKKNARPDIAECGRRPQAEHALPLPPGRRKQYGTTYGQDLSFTTSGPPRITTEPASGDQPGTATMMQRSIPTSWKRHTASSTAKPRVRDEAPSGGQSIGPGRSSGAVRDAVETKGRHGLPLSRPRGKLRGRRLRRRSGVHDGSLGARGLNVCDRGDPTKRPCAPRSILSGMTPTTTFSTAGEAAGPTPPDVPIPGRTRRRHRVRQRRGAG